MISLTPILRPALEAEGYSDWPNVVVAFDDSQVVISPDRTEDADKALDRAAIGWKGYREMKAIPEEFAPTEEEQQLLISMKLRMPVEIDGGEMMIPQAGPVASAEREPARERPTRSDRRQGGLTPGVAHGIRRGARCRTHGAPPLAGSWPGSGSSTSARSARRGKPLSLVASFLGPEEVPDPLRLVQGGADGLRSLLCEWGWEDAQAVSLCQQLEVFAARTLFETACPELPPGFVAAVERAEEVAHALGH